MTNVTEANNDLVKIWPDVLLKSITDDRVELQLTLAPDLGYFNGHFPNSPILPVIALVPPKGSVSMESSEQ